MQSEQRERLVALAARVAAESDPIRFYALLLELNELLTGSNKSIEGIEEAGRASAARDRKL